MKKIVVFIMFFCVLANFSKAQLLQHSKIFTHADTLRGTITPERAWWNVLHYDIEVKPDYDSKTITGKTMITYEVISDSYPAFMQIDLQEPLIIDSILFAGNRSVSFTKDGNAWHVQIPKQKKLSTNHIDIYYHGKPREAVKPPWDGGWIWKKDEQGRPWMSVACQGLGASVWYPCKDHQSDEPDNGATLSVTVPDSLVVVGNGRLKSKTSTTGFSTYTWEVKNPINNYDLVPYIGKYVSWNDTMQGEKGTLSLNYWVLDYNLDRAKKEFEQVKPMLHCFEYWFGPYPFYEDGYKLVESSHLGMEHQSAVAYGNGYQNGYLGRDLSGSGWGLKWDFIIVHESAHEWFGNNITTNDIADMWVHESFANYSETLYTEWLFGKEAGNEFNYGIRRNINNDEPIIGPYGVNKEGSGDMYAKGGNMLQTIRHLINNDEKWRQILRGLNSTFYHQTVTTQQIEQYISKQSGINLSKVFDQYLRTTQIPELDYYYSSDKQKIFFRWDSCVSGFNMPLVMHDANATLSLDPSQKWNSVKIEDNDRSFFDSGYLEKNYYIRMKQTAQTN